MNYRNLLTYVFYVVLFSAVQVLLVRNFVLFGMAFCYLYVGFLLLLPMDTKRSNLMLIGFFFGWLMDIFYDTGGMHAAASVAMCYMRPTLVRFLTPVGGYDSSVELSVKSLGLQWFITYAFGNILIHHIVLFYLEVASFHLFFYTIIKVICSSLLTLFVLVLTEYLIYSPNKL